VAIAALRGSRGAYPLPPRRLEIRRGRPREARIIVVMAEPEIARAAQEAAHFAGHVTMVDAQRPVRSLADRARMSLARQDGPVLLQGQPVAASARLVANFGVLRPSAPPRVVCPLALDAVVTRARQGQVSIERIVFI